MLVTCVCESMSYYVCTHAVHGNYIGTVLHIIIILLYLASSFFGLIYIPHTF